MPTADPVELAWAAGVLEGRGYFIRRTRPFRPKAPATFRIHLIAADHDVVLRLTEAFDAGTISTRVYQPSSRRAYRWDVTRLADVRAVCATIYPLMGRRRKAELDALLAAMPAALDGPTHPALKERP